MYSIYSSYIYLGRVFYVIEIYLGAAVHRYVVNIGYDDGDDYDYDDDDDDADGSCVNIDYDVNVKVMMLVISNTGKPLG